MMKLDGGNGNANDPLSPLWDAISILGIQELLLCFHEVPFISDISETS